VYPGVDGVRDPEVSCGCEDIRDPNSQGAWLDAICGDANDVILDVPGGALGDLLRFAPGGAPSLVDFVAKAGREFVLVSILGTRRDSMNTAQDAVEMFRSPTRHVVVKNGMFGREEDFIVFDGYEDPITHEQVYGATAAAVEAVGGEVVYLPELDSKTMDILDRRSMTFAVGAESAAAIGRKSAWYTRAWLDQIAVNFAGTYLSVNEVSDVAVGGKKRRSGNERLIAAG
jgi:hypothetical protein